MKLVAKIMMSLSFAYYSVTLGYMWIGQLLGLHQDIWEMFDFPPQPTSPPTWSVLIGLGVSVFTLAAIGMAYLSVWSILKGGPQQDFRLLANKLNRVGWGLIGFWFGYNILSGAVQYLITAGLESTEGFDFGWDPLDLDIVFAILGVALLAISQTLDRAWAVEEENKHFL